MDFNVSLSFSRFLGNIKEAFDKNSDLKNLLLDDFFKNAILKCQVCPALFCLFVLFVFTLVIESHCFFVSQDGWRKVVAAAVTLGIPTPAFSSALAFFDGYRSVAALGMGVWDSGYVYV